MGNTKGVSCKAGFKRLTVFRERPTVTKLIADVNGKCDVPDSVSRTYSE